jgi:hypothetical protein
VGRTRPTPTIELDNEHGPERTAFESPARLALFHFEEDYEPLSEAGRGAFVCGYLAGQRGGPLETAAYDYIGYERWPKDEMRGFAMGWCTGRGEAEGHQPAYATLQGWLYYHASGPVPQYHPHFSPESL